MASSSVPTGGDKFPPQQQSTQPGKEYIMVPLPQAINPEYKPTNKLHGKVALVTGGDSGIGRAVCYLFALEGATVAFTYVKGQEDRDKDDTLQMLRQAKTPDAKEALAVDVDIRYEENCKRVVDVVVENFGKIDILVNNAAEQYFYTSIEEISETDLERTFRTNIFSYFFMCRHALKHMKEGSSIINTTSVLGFTGSPWLLSYSATKGAIVAFTKGLANQLLKKGIRVNGVAPGPVWTPLQVASLPVDWVTSLGSEAPMDRAAQPWEIAPSYLFLASDQSSSYFTGQFLHPNGN
ncbi:Short-chain dehydrogenase/reductase SDR [Corchorus olitorius]|uniref:Short-chain dehydrogenase/reductase SDR n=1 Tax=Corchorus olitorius TaxID=93759 RepID=A0A1R3IWI8_9ROSI|nr:Short-chain dehydrogenase/reductase SDR [Corchorus olitorius]